MYEPLEAGQIRLLKVLDETGLNLSLDEYSIADPPPYACLSYTWREDECAEDTAGAANVITVNGQEKNVGKNLYDALRHLGPVVLRRRLLTWVDAVCINQDDLSERSAQVQLMKVLFERSQQVLAWIGLPNDHDETQLAMHMLKALADSVEEFKVAKISTSRLDWWLDHLNKQPSLETADRSRVRTAWAAIVNILKRPYWTRTWIHQEATVDNVTFYCGHWHFTWNELFAFSEFHMTYGASRNVDERFKLLFSGSNNVGSPLLDLLAAQADRLSAHQCGEKGSPRLLILIRLLRLTSCLDGRDKVFAALPHAKDVDLRLRDTHLVTDYTKDTIDVYTDVARYSIRHGRGPEVLGFVCMPSPIEYRPPRRPQEKLLPSWVPDWRVACRIRPLNCVGLLHGAYPIIYNPLPGTPYNEPRVVGTELHIEAIVFDKIQTTTPTVGRDVNEDDINTDWREHLLAACPTSTNKSFNRTIVVDAQHIQKDYPGPTTNLRGCAFDFELYSIRPEKRQPETQLQRMNQFHALRGITRDRRAGCIEGGKLGMFPEAAISGDLVAAFHGGDALYVIRQLEGLGGRYHFIGECYVDEMMDGQVLDLAAKKSISVLTIVLV